MERQQVESSAIAAIGYDEATQVLEVEFRAGRIYQYSPVPSTVHAWLMKAPHKGGIFNRLVRDRYQEVDVTPSVAQQDLLGALRASVEHPEEL